MKEIIQSNYNLVLGSKSPRRSQILQDAGFTFELRTQDITEDFDPLMPVLEVAEDLAKRKASALVDGLEEKDILITADSVVILDDVIYNKPQDYDEAFSILRLLSGRKHTVATGICLTSRVKTTSFTEITYITFDDLTDQEIDYYITQYQPYDKAGAYGIQDWIGLCKINKIEGSYTNVMGLPMQAVYVAIQSFITR